MLKNETKNQEDAVEKYFCIPFEKAQVYQMNQENSIFLFQLLMANKLNGGGERIIPEKKKPFLVKLIEKRIKHCFTFEINDSGLILFLAIISKTAGGAVMYLTYLQYWSDILSRLKAVRF